MTDDVDDELDDTEILQGVAQAALKQERLCDQPRGLRLNFSITARVVRTLSRQYLPTQGGSLLPVFGERQASAVRGDLRLTRGTPSISSQRPPPDLPTRMPREGWATPLLAKHLQNYHLVAPAKKS